MLNLIFDQNKKENVNTHQYSPHHQHQLSRQSIHSLILSLPSNPDDDDNGNGHNGKNDYNKKSRGYNNHKIDEKSPLLHGHKINILPSNSTIHSSSSALTYQIHFCKGKVKNRENIRFGFYVLFYCFYLVAGGLLFCFTEGPTEMAFRHRFGSVRGDFMAKYPSITGNFHHI